MNRLYSLLILLLTLAATAHAQTSCDVDKSCVGDALVIDVTSGKGAQYVDIDPSPLVTSLDTAMTFEAWIKPIDQPGKRQFIAGLWGPNRDNNDQWVFYIEGNNLVFALSADGSRMGDADNTIATASVPSLYSGSWIHVAAVWDGVSTSARIYVNGFQAASATNATYPVRRLHRPESPTLAMQIASCNGLFDDTVAYRTFKGSMDEMRLWNRALAPTEVQCQRDLSLAGNERNLVLYYRCNEPSGSQNLCNATGNGILGRMRSGAHCDTSDRRVMPTYVVTPSTVSGTLVCVSDATLPFTITDTSFCGSSVNLSIVGTDAGLFTLSNTSFTLAQNVPQSFSVQLRATITGTISARLRITNANRCGEPVEIPLDYVRTTELSYTPSRLVLDTVFVGCADKPFSEKTLRICNTTSRPMTISGARLDIDTAFTWRPADPAQALPQTLQPGGCWEVIVRMDASDTTRLFRDTLRITSDDRCPGSGIIPIEGQSQEVLVLLNMAGNRQMKSMAFEAVCPGQLSNVQVYQYRSLVNEPIQIDTIYSTNPAFFGLRSRFPIPLMPRTAYQATPVRFRPPGPGPFSGELIVRTQFRGCTITRKITLTGTGISVDVSFNDALVAFGDVTIGKTRTLGTSATNKGQDPRRMSAYLKVGDVYSIVGGRSFTIAPGQTIPINLLFRPREARVYYDTLVLFDEQCYGSISIPISGRGVFEALSFDPPYLNLENVLGCECRKGTITVRNVSSAPVTFTPSLNSPTGKFQLTPAGSSMTLPPNGTTSFEATYCPNDTTTDRSDAAYIDIRLPDGQLYQVLLKGTSVVPKLLVSPLTTFGTVESGWRKRDSILVENISAVPVSVDGVTVPAGYTILSTSRTLPTTLAPRDSMWVYVEFAPTAEANYNGPVVVTSNSPCPIKPQGTITGRGVVVKLTVASVFRNFGLVKPCDCPTISIPLNNGSSYIPISIDSIWIDGAGVTSPRPQVFRWRSQLTGGTTLPYNIPPGQVDSLAVTFCPDIPATNANVLSNAKLHIKASTPGWSEELTTTLSGRRELNFTPSRTLVQFPATRVDTAATPIIVDINVPDPFSNPSGDSVVITDVSFVPDQRVFSYEAVNGQPLPWVIKRGERFQIRVRFYPRAPKVYQARMHLKTSFPCDGVDTTILVRGEGFAPAFGLQMLFDTTAISSRAIFRLNTCDTLELPIMSTRAIPQSLIDIAMRIGYDSTSLKLIDVISPYTSNATVSDTGDGARVYLKDARNAQAGTIATVRFRVIGGATSFPVALDGIDFDSDSLVFFKIVAGIDSAVVVIDEPKIAISQSTRFDTVNMKSCADREVLVWNPGAIDIRFDSLGGLPPGHRVTASSIPYPTTLAPGDTIRLTVTFCPFIEALYDTTILAVSNYPCPIADTGRIYSFGYAPPFPFDMSIEGNNPTRDSVVGTIVDTIGVRVMVDRDIPQTPLDVRFRLLYNRRALQFMSATSPYGRSVTATEGITGIDLAIDHCDSIVAGEIAQVKFVVAVPDSTISPIFLDVRGSDFTSDSVFWVKLIPTGDTSLVRVDPYCNITRLVFKAGGNKLSAPTPSPSRGMTSIEAEFVFDSRARLRIFNSAGLEVATLVDGEETLAAGRYRFDFDTSTLSAGAYFILLEAGTFRATERMVVE